MSGSTSDLSESFAKLQRAFSQVDPANRRAVFLQWPTTMTSEERLERMQNFVTSKFPHDPPSTFGNFYGKDKKPTSSYVEFHSPDTRNNFITTVANKKLEVQGKTVVIKKARAQLGYERNKVLRKAEELIKASTVSNGKTVNIEWLQKERTATVDGAVAFAQPPGALSETG